MRLFGLIGYPLGHSFSKNYFSKKFKEEGITGCQYELFPIRNIAGLLGLLQSYPRLHGLNVTIPYKLDVLAYLSESCIPPGLNACNCISIKDKKLVGYNTDIVGFEKSFSENCLPHHTNALVLGNGGAAAAVIYVLNKLGIGHTTAGRSKKPGVDLLYTDITPEMMENFPVVINTTPLGTFPTVDECPFIPYNAVTDKHYLFDLVYNPAETLFLQKGAERGAIVQNGYEMLVYQAEEAWRIWNEAN